jgi:hypothetical protein
MLCTRTQHGTRLVHMHMHACMHATRACHTHNSGACPQQPQTEKECATACKTCVIIIIDAIMYYVHVNSWSVISHHHNWPNTDMYVPTSSHTINQQLRQIPQYLMVHASCNQADIGIYS